MPYGSLKAQEVHRKVREGVRPEKAVHTKDEFHEICLSCWKIPAAHRPTFSELQKKLSDILTREGKKELRDIGQALAQATKKGSK